MISAVIAICVLFICLYFKWQYSYWNRRKVEGPAPLPIFGNMFEYIVTHKRHFGEIYQEAYQSYPKARYVGMYKSSQKALLIRDLDLVKEILVTAFSNFNKNDWEIDPKIDPLLAANPFMIPGDEWKPVRSQLAPLFTASRTKFAIPFMNDIGKKMLEYLDSGVEDLDCLEIKELSSKYLTDVIACHAFGIDGECFTKQESELRKIGHSIFDPTFWNGVRDSLVLVMPDINKLLKVPFVSKEIDRKVRNLVNQVIKERQEKNIKRNDLLQSVMEMKDKLKDFDEYLIPGHAFSFLTEGYETSSLIMSFTLYELATNPDIQKKVQKEIDAAFEESKGEINDEFLQKLEYLERCITETGRVHSPVFQLTKVCLKQYEFPGQYESSNDRLTIEPGTLCVIPSRAIHFDPEYFPDPYKYDPDRYLPEIKESRHKYAYLGFGEGPRICVGMKYGVTQVKAGIATILGKYNLTLSEKCEQPLKISKTSFMYCCEHGILLKFKKRA